MNNHARTTDNSLRNTYGYTFPVFDTINEQYSGYAKYLHQNCDVGDDLIYITVKRDAIMSGSTIISESICKHLVCNYKDILSTYDESSSFSSATVGGAVTNGYFAMAYPSRSFYTYIRQYNKTSNTISAIRSVSSGRNWPTPNEYAYTQNGTSYICIGQSSSRETPGLVNVSSGAYNTASYGTGGRTLIKWMTHLGDDSTYPYIGILYYLKSTTDFNTGPATPIRMVKCNLTYNVGRTADSTPSTYTGCSEISNTLDGFYTTYICREFLTANPVILSYYTPSASAVGNLYKISYSSDYSVISNSGYYIDVTNNPLNTRFLFPTPGGVYTTLTSNNNAITFVPYSFSL